MSEDKATRPVLFAAAGTKLTTYDVDIEAAALTPRSTVTMPAPIHYVWSHAQRKFLYLGLSNSKGGYDPSASLNQATALRVDPKTGALTEHGPSIKLPARPIHVTTDNDSKHLLVVSNFPPLLKVFAINDDGTLGAEVPAKGKIDAGFFPHQVRITPDNCHAIIAVRGEDSLNGKPEEPGGLKLFDFMNGVISNESTIAPNGGFGFGARHLDFHPTHPWIYVSLERQQCMAMFEWKNGTIATNPTFMRDCLGRQPDPKHHQMVGTVHVHPNGRTVYVANRASSEVDYQGQKIFAGGENSIVAFSIDPDNGRPELIQRIDSHGFHPRTFHIDPTGKLMAVAHTTGMKVKEGDAIRAEAAHLSLFKIAEDGKLGFVRSYDIDPGASIFWWVGIFNLPG